MKLSNGALKKIKRGWYREAVVQENGRCGEIYCIQCTTWNDKKQVMFLHTDAIGRSEGLSVRRHVKGKSRRVELDAPILQREYIRNFSAVEKNDRDSADFTCSIKTHR